MKNIFFRWQKNKFNWYRKSLLTLSISVVILFSCSKKNNYQPSDFLSPLTSYTWQLTSTTKMDSNNKIISRYVGAKNDSILFNFILDRNWNVVPTQVYSYIGNTATVYDYSQSYDFATKTDVLLFSPDWAANYSDSLFFPQWNNYEIIFKVKNLLTNGYEIDSFKSGRLR